MAGLRLQVLRYENGQEYGAHWDWFDDPVKHADQMTAGNRIATVLMYLSGGLEVWRALHSMDVLGGRWLGHYCVCRGGLLRFCCIRAAQLGKNCGVSVAADVEEGGETAFPHGTYVNEAKQKSGQYSPCGDEGVAVRPKKVPPLLPCRAASFCGRTWHHCLRAHTTPAPLYAKDRSGSKLHRPHLHAHTPHTAAARQLANQRDSRMQRWCCQCTCQRGGIPGLQSAFPAGRMCTAPPSRFSS